MTTLHRKSLASAVALFALLLPAGASAGPQAGLMLKDSSAELCHSNDTAWQLANEAALDEANHTVTWTVTATRGETSNDHLDVDGYVSILNTGLAGATVGNIVVNLQAQTSGKKPKWETRSSDVADATNGDAATFARVVPGASSEGQSSFTENAASGRLSFTDASNNTVFSLVPEVTIAPGSAVNLLFSARFDNTVLGLAVGTPVRGEVIVSFGNAGARGGGSVANNVDINGNGTIDADEANVRSVSTRITRAIPPLEQGNDTVTLTDTADDITTTGTVTITDVTTDIGAGTGSEVISDTTVRTVTATFDGGSSGGTITDCAHLTGSGSTVTVNGPIDLLSGLPIYSYSFPCVTGVDLEKCDSETVSGGDCAADACCGDCGWEDGDFVTYPQESWGAIPSGSGPAALLAANFSAVYPSGFVEVGIPGAGGFSMTFSGASVIKDYLPASGSPGALNADLVDPFSSASGAFGGNVLGLQLNVDFSNAGITLGSLGIKFGDLTLRNFSAGDTFGVVLTQAQADALNGQTVAQFLAEANTLLGGGAGTYGLPISAMDVLAVELTLCFDGGFVDAFAQDHLYYRYQDGDFVTYSQGTWGADPSGTNAAAVLAANFTSVYPSGSVEVGIAGSAGYSMNFTSAPAINNYLPASGTPAALNADLVDPLTSASGSFGGQVLALELNVDFADAGITTGAVGTSFGNLTLCNLTDLPLLNGLSVSEFLALANTALGGGSHPYTFDELSVLTADLNTSFGSGFVSPFAQDHLCL